jgi:DNA modification methylase
MSALVVRADAAHLPLPDASVDLIVTSPPYFALRSYQDGGEHYAGQIGSEASPQEFLEALWTCTREWMRVLKPTGSLFVNLGDKYVADNRGSGSDRKRGDAKHAPAGPLGFVGRETARQKSLMGLPWRYAIGCIDQLGLILRAEIVWAKPNGLPESVTDRVRRSHEQWFHFTLQLRYFSAVDEIREPHQDMSLHAQRRGERTTAYRTADLGAHSMTSTMNPLGKLPGSVWEIPSEPLTVPADLGVDHFAAFPTAWPKRLILGWSPAGICTACGEGRRPVTEVDNPRRSPEYRHDWTDNPGEQGRREASVVTGGASALAKPGWRKLPPPSATITGYACGCPDTSARSRPAVVLDPFGGTGTTAAVASALGRIGISVDLSHDYSRLAQWRTTDPATRAKIRGERPPVKQADGQEELFGRSVA